MELPRPLSHSSISLYEECPQKYKFRYIEKIPEKPKHFFSFGSSVHEALEFFYGVKTLPAPRLEEVLSYYREHWISAGYKDNAQEQEYFQDGEDILKRFYQKHIADFQIPFFVEYKFDFKVDGVPITGRIDRIDKTPDGKLSVTDYKTGKALEKERVLTDGQLTLYQIACEELLGAPVSRLSFYHLPTLKEQTIERHSEEIVSDLRKKITRVASSISQELFAPSPSEQKCRWTNYKHICQVYQSDGRKNGASCKKAALQAPLMEDPPAEELPALVDRYGEIRRQIRASTDEAEDLKKKILASFKEKGFVRAFGKKFEVNLLEKTEWEFSDKNQILAALKKAGIYERTLGPRIERVIEILEDADLPQGLKDELSKFAQKTLKKDLKLNSLSD